MSNASGQLRVGLVGCGSIAAELEDLLRSVPGYFLFPYGHATLFTVHPATRLVAVADPRPGAADGLGRRFGIDAQYRSHQELLESVDVDILSVAAPTRFHAEIAIDAAAAGVKGLFLEKPVAETLADADRMIDACDTAGVATVVNHFRTFDPVWRQAAVQVSDGQYGDVTGVVATWGEGISQGGCHLFDYLRTALNSRVSWAQAYVEEPGDRVDPGATFVLGYESDVRASVHMEWRTVAPPQLEILGTKGMVRLGNFDVRQWRFEEMSERVIPVEVPFAGRHDGKSGMTVALDQLIDAIEGRGTPLSTLENGRAALETTLAVLASGEFGTRVELPFNDAHKRAPSWL